jgi:hypothetical protein
MLNKPQQVECSCVHFDEEGFYPIPGCPKCRGTGKVTPPQPLTPELIRDVIDRTLEICLVEHCDRFYIVAAPGIVKLEEVPAGWGFLECRPPSNRLRQLKPAPDLQGTTRKQVSLGMFIGILRAAERAWWKPTSAQMEKVAREARAAGYESGKESAARGPGDQQREIARLQGIIRDFEQRAKVSIHEYNAGEIGSIVELVSMLDGRYNLLSRVEQADRVLTAALAEVRKAIAALAKEKVT